MAEWSFLTNHARALLCIADDPGVRLRDIAGTLLITERSAFGIVNDLVEAGYVRKEREGRRNRYEVQGHLPLPDPIGRTRTVGEVLDLLVGEIAGPTGRTRPKSYARGADRATSPA
jgi:DNA-binding transcriptional ArsR family regulator